MEMVDKRLVDRDANTPFQIIRELFNVLLFISLSLFASIHLFHEPFEFLLRYRANDRHVNLSSSFYDLDKYFLNYFKSD